MSNILEHMYLGIQRSYELNFMMAVEKKQFLL